jgi:S-DNA-T family DNA segregation ATPase FtsK/SpoIIIE
MPSLDLLEEPLKEETEGISDEELKENGRLLQAKLLHFDVKIEKVIATPGPVVTLYELIPAEDVKLSRIESLEDDIALAMKARGIRMIIPIPGKGTVGVEIPNQKPSIVKIKGVIGSKKFNDTHYQLPIALGKTISGEVFVDDLAKMPQRLRALQVPEEWGLTQS